MMPQPATPSNRESATPRGLALRIVRFPISQGGPVTASIAAMPSTSGIEVMGQQQNPLLNCKLLRQGGGGIGKRVHS